MNRPAESHTGRLSYEEWRRTHPPIMGGDEGLTGEVVAEGLADVIAPEGEADEGAAPEGTSGGADEVDLGLNFRLEDVPEEYREHVSRYTKQVQGAYTRKTQELAEQRKTLTPLSELQANLEDDTKRDAALRELLTRYGWEVEGAEAVDDEDDVDEDEDDNGDEPQSDLEARLARIEAREAEERAGKFQERVTAHVESALTAYADAEGLEVIPDGVKAGIAAQLRGLDPTPEGLPDMERAIALYEEQRQLAVAQYLESKRGTDMDLSGVSSAKPTFDPRDPKARRARADAIAGRHL